jgi:uncharacterized protein (TIGR00730 family)
MNKIRSICVYCGSSPGGKTDYLQAASILGTALGQNDIRLVYGGGNSGIMGGVANATFKAGGKVLGIIPRFLMNREASGNALDSLSELIITENMHERKHALFENSDAFVALPGGIGTVEEIVEVMTWAQLGRHKKPIVFANIAGFWNPMLQLIDHMKAEGFIHTANLVNPLVVDDAIDIVPAILASAKAKSVDGVTSIIERL